jgi:hypothetical protein
MNLHIEDLNINPFLIRLLEHEFGLTDARSIVQWLVHQRLERGTVTSFGIALENMAKVFSEGTGVEGADVLKTKRGRRYYIQVKSGPNTVPKDLAVRITDLLHSAQRRNRGSLALFGMCYGNPEQVSGIVHKYVGVEAISGRKFWEFISDDPNCIDEIYEIAAKVGSSFRFAHGLTLGQILQNKVTELVNEFRQRYGESGADMWRKLLELNS